MHVAVEEARGAVSSWITLAGTLYFAGSFLGIAAFLTIVFAAPRRLDAWLLATGSLLAAGLSAMTALQDLRFLSLGGDPSSALSQAIGRTAAVYAEPMSFVALAFVLLVAYPGRRWASRAAWLTLALGAASTLVILVAQDRLYHDGVPPLAWDIYDITLAYDGVVIVNVTLLVTLLLRAPPGRERDGLAWLALAFALGAILSAPESVIALVVSVDRSPHDRLHWLGDAFVLLALLANAWRLRGPATRRYLVAPLALGGFVLGSFLVAVATGSRVFSQLGIDYGRIGSVARPLMLLVAVLRFGVLGEDVAPPRAVTRVATAIAAAAAFLPVEEALRAADVLPSDVELPLAMAAGFAASMAAYATLRKLWSPATEDDALAAIHEGSALLRARKHEVYAAAIERALRDGTADAGADDLRRLRGGLGLTTREHDEIVARVRAELATDDDVAAAARVPGSMLLGRYRIERLLGEGAGGRTYRATDARLGRQVAVKELAGESITARQRALREARLLARVHHANVVSLFEAHEVGARIFLVMEYVEGGSLADALAREGKLRSDEARRILADVLDGLSALHATGLVHRDIKPSNILLDAQGRAKIADLGIAKATDADATATRGLRAPGTPPYMSPEQVLGLPVDARSDLYAAAALLFEMLEGEMYTRRASQRGILLEDAIVSRPPPLPLASAPSWANSFIRRGLSKDPAARFASAREARDALRSG